MSNEITLKNDERQPCEIWTRVMGYFRPYGHYNLGKKSEFDERKWFVEKKAIVDTSAYLRKAG